MFNTPVNFNQWQPTRDEDEASAGGSESSRDGRYVRVVSTRDLASRRKLVQNLRERLDRRQVLPPPLPTATHFQRFLYAMEEEMEDTVASMTDLECIAFMREVLQACLPSANYHLFNISTKRRRLLTSAAFLKFCYEFLAQKDSVHISALAIFEQRQWAREESIEKYIHDLHELGAMAHITPRVFASRFVRNMKLHPRQNDAIAYFTTGAGVKALEEIPSTFSFENLESAVLVVCGCRAYLDSLEEFDPIAKFPGFNPVMPLAAAGGTDVKEVGETKQLKTGDKPASVLGKRKLRDISTVVCYSCNKVGHYKSHCPEVICELCNEPGHVKRVCRMREKKRFSSSATFDVSKMNKKQRIALLSQLQGDSVSPSTGNESVELIPGGGALRVDSRIMALAMDLQQAQKVLEMQDLVRSQQARKP